LKICTQTGIDERANLESFVRVGCTLKRGLEGVEFVTEGSQLLHIVGHGRPALSVRHIRIPTLGNHSPNVVLIYVGTIGISYQTV
jgi:hypothetical protein